MHTCAYCDSEFKYKSDLNRHQKTAKFCLSIQERNKNNVIEKRLFNCTFCNKELSSKSRLTYHLNICKSNNKKTSTNIQQINQQIQEMSKKIETLHNPVQNITINNTTLHQTNHNYGSILSLSKELIKETFDKNYTLEDFFGSQKALADFTNKHFLRGKDNPLYLCTDKSRQKFVYIDEQHQETEDINAEIMIKLMSKGFHKMTQLYDEEDSILQKRLKQFLEDDDNTNIIETRSQIKILEDTYKQLLTIFKNGDKYRIQLSKILPSTVENRLLHDERLSDEETYGNAQLEKLKNKNKINDDPLEVLDEPKYDKTARHIGGITYGGLRMYKDHYLKTGKKVYHPKHIGHQEFMKKFDEFCDNDE